MKKQLKRYIVSLAVLFPIVAMAQFQPMKENNAEERKDLTFGQRFSLRTNTVDWALMTPNVSVGIDLGNSPYNRMTLNLSGRYNWNTKPDTKAYHVYDINEGKVEVRKYYHTQQRNTPYEGLEKFFSSKRKNPRYWRAYYWGIYAAYTDFAFKFSRHGYGGEAIHSGMSFGMERSLFTYKKTCLDLEVGASAGIAYWDGYKFKLDRETNNYLAEKTFKKILPVLSEVRVALVYRFGPSAKNRYLYNQEKSIQRTERKMERDKLKAEKEAAEKAKDDQKKAEKIAKKEAKDAEKSAKKEQKMNKKKAAYQEKMDKKYGEEGADKDANKE